MKIRGIHIVLVSAGIILINIVANHFHSRWDLTKDKRYTLSNATKNIVQHIDKKMMIKVYLEGDFPLDFKRLQQESRNHLEELKAYNSDVHYRFINPNGLEKELVEKGLQPSSLTVEEKGSISETLIFPWAEIKYKGKTTNISLLINTSSEQESQLQRSIENLEYAFSNGIAEVTQKKEKTIAILRGNGELEDIYLVDFLQSLKGKYNLVPFTLKHAGERPKLTLSNLKKYDLAIFAKPSLSFTEEEKLVVDQYIMNGGKTMWLIDNVYAEMDSLQETGKTYVTNRDLNLTDLLFSYGVRVNFNLVQDLYSSKIAIATGNIGNKTQFQQFLWSYYPLVTPNSEHAITKNLKAINLKFPSGIDTLKNGIKKNILLQSSPLTKVSGTPSLVELRSIVNKVTPEQFASKSQILGVLLEGKFTSAYLLRTLPFELDIKEKSNTTKMIVIGDGDIIANQVINGKPAKMDIDKWTGQRFGNKDFLLNAVDYLLDDSGLLSIRGKSLDIKTLNKEKVSRQQGYWQLLNIVVPIVLLGIFGIGFNYYRKRKYT